MSNIKSVHGFIIITQTKQKYCISNHPKCSIYYEYPARIYSYDKIDVYIWLKKNIASIAHV